jgi:hypothetical protein
MISSGSRVMRFLRLSPAVQHFFAILPVFGQNDTDKFPVAVVAALRDTLFRVWPPGPRRTKHD